MIRIFTILRITIDQTSVFECGRDQYIEQYAEFFGTCPSIHS